MKFIRIGFWSIIISLLWSSTINATDITLFDAGNYPVDFPIEQDLTILAEDVSKMEYLTGNNKVGSLRYPFLDITSPFEMTSLIFCQSGCSIILSLVSEEGVFSVNILGFSSAFSGGQPSISLKPSYPVIEETGWVPDARNVVKLSVNGDVAKLYINDIFAGKTTFKAGILYNSLVISLNQQNSRLYNLNINGTVTTGTYDDGKKVAIQQCVANPSSCGITKIDGISTNAFVSPANKMIAGVLISGGTKRVMVRASSVDGAVDPFVEIYTYPDRKLLGNNDSWATDPAAAELTQKKLAPARATDAAMIINLPSGLFTAEVSSKNGGSGANVIEVYDMAVFP